MRFIRMTILSLAIATSVGAAVLAGVVHAQGAKATLSDPEGLLPDPTHIPMVLPAWHLVRKAAMCAVCSSARASR